MPNSLAYIAANDASNFLPNQIGNLAGWIKADGLNYSDGVSVHTVTDFSVNNVTLTQTTSANMPKYRASNFNGKPSLVFDGTTSVLNWTNSNFNSSNKTAFVVAYAGSNFAAPSAFFARATADYYLAGGAGLSGAMSYARSDGSQQFVSTAADFFANGTPTVNTYRMFLNNPDVTLGFYKNGSTYLTTTLAASGNGLGIGAGWVFGAFNAAVAASFSGNIAEFILYTTTLSDLDRRRVERYLGKKWGVSVQ